MKMYFTEKDYKELLSNIVIIHDTREQENGHILEAFDKKKIAHEERKQETGDYNFYVKANAELGFLRDTYFTDELFIERKNSLDELAQSLLAERFHNELKRAKNRKWKYLICENASWEKILKHEYQSNYNEKSFWNTLQTLMFKYDLQIIFIDKSLSYQIIYSLCKKCLEQQIEH